MALGESSRPMRWTLSVSLTASGILTERDLPRAIAADKCSLSQAGVFGLSRVAVRRAADNAAFSKSSADKDVSTRNNGNEFDGPHVQ